MGEDLTSLEVGCSFSRCSSHFFSMTWSPIQEFPSFVSKSKWRISCNTPENRANVPQKRELFQ